MFHLTRSGTKRLSGRALLLLTAIGLPCLADDATAQDFEVGPGLVVEFATSSTAPGLSEGMQQGLNQAFALIARLLVPPGYDGLLDDAMEDLGPPQTVSQDVTAYIKGARIRVDIGANSLLGRLAPDGSVSEWAVLDRASGQVMQSTVFDRAVRERSGAEYEAFGEDAQVRPMGVTTGNEVRTILGHPARKYTFTREVILPTEMEGQDGRRLGASVMSTTDVWVATEGPYTEDAGIVQFFRVFGSELNMVPAGSPGSGLPAGAVILETHEEAIIKLGSVGGTQETLATASSSAVIRSISRRDLDDAMFDGFERGQQGCDCSCSAFKELQAISKLPKQEQQNHPRAMKLAMCGAQCGGAWASFPKSVYEGGECPGE